MHRTVVVSFLAVAVFAGRSGDDVRVNGGSHVALEQVRLRAHFDSVLDELRARDVSRLTADQRAARSELTTWLAEYRDAGRFPLNDRYAESLTPIFRDARGVTCAMAYLIERSGRRDVVDRIARTRNLAYVGELADDPALVAWLDSVGFDAFEAASVQPAYPQPPRKVGRGYAIASLVMSGSSVATTYANFAEPNRAVGLAGMMIGSITIVTGSIPRRADAIASQTDLAVSALNYVTGAAAVLTGIYSLVRSPAIRQEQASNWGIEFDPGRRDANGAPIVRVGLIGRF